MRSAAAARLSVKGIAHASAPRAAVTLPNRNDHEARRAIVDSLS